MNNLKKRRAYSHEESPEPVLQDLTPSSSGTLDAVPIPPAYRYILEQAPSTHVRVTVPLSKLLDLNRPDHQHYLLEQAASAINVPLPVLLALSNRQHQVHKRPRLHQTVPMPPPYPNAPGPQDSQEKSPLAAPSNRAVNTNRKVFASVTDGFPAWSGTRLADCLANFSMCPPCSTYDSTYQPLPATAPFDYDGSRPVLEGPVVSLQPQAQAVLAPAPMSSDQAALFACDDTALMAQYMATYPPLQPTRVMTMQPPATREMVYPVTPQIVKFDDSPEANRGATGLGIQGQSLISTTVVPNAISSTYSAEPSSPSYGRESGYVQVQHFNSVQGFEVKDEQQKPQTLEVQARSTTFDLFPHQRTIPARRGPFKDHDQREKTALTRKIGSCIRCRMQRIRCNLDTTNERGPCIACKKIAFNTKIYRLSCLRWKLTDVKLFKPGQVKGHEWTIRWRDSVVDDIGTWASSDLRIIQVTEGYTGRSVRLKVRRFQPLEGDRLERSWVSDGVKKFVTIPPFAIVDMESTKAAFDEYIKESLIDCCKRLLGQRGGELLWQTYALAIQIMRDESTPESERSLLISTLDLWMSVRLTTKSFEIVGNDTLDMPRDIIQDETNPLHGKIPLPPVMGAQIDSVLIHQIQPQLRRRTLEELQKMTQDKKQKTWLTTYLVTFILLHNIALITKHDAEYAQKHGMDRRFARVDNVKEYNLGANTLLAYFHYCNKGIYPFSADCKDQDLQSLAELDNDAMSFVKYTRLYASDHSKQWQDLWANNNYEEEYYYVSQLFEQNWQPRVMS